MIHDSKRLLDLLPGRFPPNQYAIAHEVVLPDWDGHERRLDAMAWGHNPRTGFEIVGVEAKTSRADLITELKNPAKWEAARRVCDRFYLVLGSPHIVVDGDPVPNEWGTLMSSEGGALYEGRSARRLHLHGRERPPVERHVVASFLSRLLYDPDAKKNHVAHQVRVAVAAAEEKAFNEGLKLGKKKRLTEELELP